MKRFRHRNWYKTWAWRSPLIVGGYESPDILNHFPLFVSVKTITTLNLGQGETFEIKIKKFALVIHFPGQRRIW